MIELVGLLLEAHQGRAWIPLGYNSWDDYVHSEFGISRRRSFELRVFSWTCSASWREAPYLGLAFQPGSLVAEAFEAQDHRAGDHVPLGITHRDGVFDIEAHGYTYPRRGEAWRQVAVLIRS